MRLFLILCCISLIVCTLAFLFFVIIIAIDIFKK